MHERNTLVRVTTNSPSAASNQPELAKAGTVFTPYPRVGTIMSVHGC